MKDATWNTTTKVWSYPTFTLGALVAPTGYNIITPASDVEQIHKLILQKKDGRFYIVIWNEALSWKRGSPGTAFTVADVNCVLRVANPVFTQIKVWRPTVFLADSVATANSKRDTPFATPAVTNLGNATGVTIPVPDHVILIELIP